MKNRPAAAKAAAFLRETIDRCRSNGVGRLDPIVRLAANAGVGLSTMAHAVAGARESGELLTRRGRGTTIAGHSPSASAPVAVPLWHGIAQAITGDIGKGTFLAGEPLPSHKYLETHYGVSFRTVRKALRILVSTGILESFGRQYKPVPLPVSADRNTVVLIAGGTGTGELRLYSQRTHEYLRSLESLCTRSNVTLKIHPFDVGTSSLCAVRTRREMNRDFKNTLGFIVWATSFGAPALAGLLSSLYGYEKPVTVFHEGAIDPCPLPRNPRVPLRRFCAAAGPRAGLEIGRYLIGKGHRCVAYLSPLHGSEWSRTRRQGLTGAFIRAGRPDGVVPFVSESVGAELRDQPLHDTDGNLLFGSTGQFLAVSRHVKSLANQVELLLQRETYRGDMRELMDRALRCGPATAWVAANDNFALECLDFLRGRGVRVPADIALAGFDDSLEGFFQKLTSYNFNGPAYMRAMLAHVLRPDRTMKPDRESVTEIEGHVVARETA